MSVTLHNRVKKENRVRVKRGKLEARADDKPEVVRDRLRVYHEETAPLKDFYAERNLLKAVDNQPTVTATTEAILKALGL